MHFYGGKVVWSASLEPDHNYVELLLRFSVLSDRNLRVLKTGYTHNLTGPGSEQCA